MTMTFSAIFENGVFRPIEPVDFPEHCRVQVEVHAVQPSLDDGRGNPASANAATSRRVRLVGELVAVRAGARDFDLVLDDGRRLAIEFAGGDMAAVVALINQRVLVLGTAHYGPSGDLLRVDADDVRLSRDAGQLFSAVPETVRADFCLDDFFHDQRHKLGLSAIIGQWPGDESDDEVIAALKELS